VTPRLRIKSLFSISTGQWRAILWARRQLFSIDQSLNDHGLATTKQDLLSSTDARISQFEGRGTKYIVRVIRRAARLSIGNTDSCLRRSLLLWWILHHQGVNATVKVGVSSKDGALLGHAWVELDDKPLNDLSNVRDAYKVIDLDTVK